VHNRRAPASAPLKKNETLKNKDQKIYIIMGVHGLTRHIRSLGHLDATATIVDVVEGSKLCVDGDGLIFHLFRLSYRAHYKNVVAADSSAGHHRSKLLKSQLLLPLFTPLSLIHHVTTTFLSDLLSKGLYLEIFFDGPDQFMKRRQRRRRQDQRNEEWENTRQLCIHGILPETGPAQSRSAAHRQARKQFSSVEAADSSDDEAEFFLANFPFGKLAFLQIKHSIREFAHISSVLFRGSIQLINCDGEADVAVARASASEKAAYALANDSDFLIYGTKDKVVKYICFDQLNPSDKAIRVSVLTRSEVSDRIGLFCAEAMIDLSIILGNDYTGPLLRHNDALKQKEYWSSLRWQRDDEYETLSSELNNRMQPVIDHVGERVAEGWRLTSVMEELKLAIEYSYALYSFGNTECFRSRANTLDDDNNDVVDDDDDDNERACFIEGLGRIMTGVNALLSRDVVSSTMAHLLISQGGERFTYSHEFSHILLQNMENVLEEKDGVNFRLRRNWNDETEETVAWADCSAYDYIPSRGTKQLVSQRIHDVVQ